jgi:cellulose synthase/poly-beta-1,6-N-acetylglucosamine synthase-like glycosyltransferase
MQVMNSRYVSVIVPTYEDWDLLVHCVNALSNQSYPKERFEVIIINNNAPQATPKNLSFPDNFKLIAEEKPGSYAARNTGLRVAKGEIIGFTDADCIPHKDWIKNAVDYFEENKSCSRIAGNISVFCESRKPTKAELFDKFYAFPQKSYALDMGTSVTANSFTYKHVFDKVGMFDEGLMSGGDILWGKLAHRASYKIDYVENVIVEHPAIKTLGLLTKKAKRYAGGTVQSYAEHQSKTENLFRFLYNLKSRLRNMKYVYIKRKEGGACLKELNAIDRINIALIKYYLICVRACEIFRVQMGKKPNRT